MTPASNGGSVLLRQELAPGWVRCAHCQRERLWRDIFWHSEDQVFYCANTFACEARHEVLWERGELDDWRF